MNTPPVYDIAHFRAKFMAIPAERWCSGHLTGEDGTRCALGHCGVRFGKSRLPDNTVEGLALGAIFHSAGLMVADVNDGYEDRFHQPTERDRVLAALDYIEAKLAKKGVRA